MADRWIVTSYSYERHRRLPDAEGEAKRLRTDEPKKHWRVYRVKTTLPAGNTKAVLEAADELCSYIGKRIDDTTDTMLIRLAAKLKYEVATRVNHQAYEEFEELKEFEDLKVLANA